MDAGPRIRGLDKRGEGSMITSALDDATLTRMRAEAAADRSPFIDPRLLREAGQVLPWVDRGWLTRVIGRQESSWMHLGNAEMSLAVRAAEADAAYLQSLRDQVSAEREERSRIERAETVALKAAERQAWEDLRAKLPVLVEVMHNWTARHLDGYEQGGDHIVALAGFTVGRLHREQYQSLCWTPSRAHELRYVDSSAGDEKRIPNCKACLRHAANLAGRQGNNAQ
jgi:hypothetical protein